MKPTDVRPGALRRTHDGAFFARILVSPDEVTRAQEICVLLSRDTGHSAGIDRVEVHQVACHGSLLPESQITLHPAPTA